MLRKEIRKIKCGADERRLRRLDGAKQIFPGGEKQTNLLKSTMKITSPKGGVIFMLRKEIRKIKCGADERRLRRTKLIKPQKTNAASA